MVCKCGCKEFFTQEKGTHKGLYCSSCGSWIKWLSKNEYNQIKGRSGGVVWNKYAEQQLAPVRKYVTVDPDKLKEDIHKMYLAGEGNYQLFYNNIIDYVDNLKG